MTACIETSGLNSALASAFPDLMEALDFEGVLDGELLDGPDYAQRPLPAVLPPWLRSRRIATATLRWAARYAMRHLGFHFVRVPG